MRQNWKLIVVTAVLASVLGGVVGSAVAMLWPDSNHIASRGRIVRVGGPETLPGIENTPWCDDFDHFCIVEPKPGQFLALYTYDTHEHFRQQGCTVHWDASFTREDPATGQEKTGWFMAGCSGSTFDMPGRRVFGPSPRDLDQFPLTESNGEFLVDTRTLICATPSLKGSESPCDRAPPPQ
jgi:hypothetical protein